MNKSQSTVDFHLFIKNNKTSQQPAASGITAQSSFDKKQNNKEFL